MGLLGTFAPGRIRSCIPIVLTFRFAEFANQTLSAIQLSPLLPAILRHTC